MTTHAPAHGTGQVLTQREGALSRGAGLVADARVELTGHNTRLSELVGDLRTGWHGRGAASFFALHQAWHERQTRVVAILDELSRSLTDTERDTVATDEGQDAAYVRLATRLG